MPSVDLAAPLPSWELHLRAERKTPTQPAGGLRARVPEIRRCVKRAIARQLFKLLQRYDRPDVEVVRVA
jgi:hypothetical protein